MAQAQMDLYNMLGITVQDIPGPRLERSSSLSASPVSPRPPASTVNGRRPVSDVIGHRDTRGVGVLEAFRDLMVNDPEAVLATFGMIDN